MPEKKETDDTGTKRGHLFKAKSSASREVTATDDSVLSDIPERKNEEKIDTPEAKTRRVKDLLKSFSKFDEDIMRLQGIEDAEPKGADSINDLSIEEMQIELQEYLLKRDKTKTNLDQLVQRVNQTSETLEKEEEKIKVLEQQLQLRKRNFSNLGDE